MISSDFEDRLREQMHHATAGATAAAVAAVAVTTGAVGAPQDARTYTTAYVVGHVESALGAAAAADDIAYLHVPGNSSNMWFYAPLPRAGGAGIAQTHAPSGST